MHQEEDCSVSTENKESVITRQLEEGANYGVTQLSKNFPLR